MKMNSDIKSMLDLPEEIQLRVLEYLDSKSLIKASSVCLLWRELINSSSTMRRLPLTICEYDIINGCKKLQQIDSKVTDVIVFAHSCPVKLLDFLESQKNWLKIVRFHYINVRRSLLWFFKTFRHISELHFRDCTLKAMRIEGSEIKWHKIVVKTVFKKTGERNDLKKILCEKEIVDELEVDRSKSFADDSIAFMIRPKKLSLDSPVHRRQRENFIRFLRNNCQQLEEIKIFMCACNDPEIIKTILTELKSLKKIIIYGSELPKADNQDFYYNLQISKSIENIVVKQNFFDFDLTSERKFLSSISGLYKSLSLHFPVGNGIMENILGKNQLQFLELEELIYETDYINFPSLENFSVKTAGGHGLYRFMSNHPKIKVLRIKWIEDKDLCLIKMLMRIIRKSVHLKHVDIRGETRIMLKFYNLLKHCGVRKSMTMKMTIESPDFENRTFDFNFMKENFDGYSCLDATPFHEKFLRVNYQ